MGKATIISDDGEGRYTIKVLHDTTVATANLAKVDALITKLKDDIDEIGEEIDLLEASIASGESALSDAEAALTVAEGNLSVTEDAMNSDPAYNNALQDVRDARNELAAAQAEDPVNETRVAAAQAALETAQTALDNVATKAAYDAAEEQVKAATDVRDDARSDLDSNTEKLDEAEEIKSRFELRLIALNKTRTRIYAAQSLDYQTQAWCADLTTGLTGNVGTIEPGTDRRNGINIQPGHDGNAVYNGARDGIAVPFLTMNVADAMRNFAIMPAIQKWRPTYRYGTIAVIDQAANTCTLSLDDLTSRIQNLDINQASVLADVPIDYMSCDAAAFENGDEVIVKFDGFSQSSPKVIGFQDHPKSCLPYIVISLSSGAGAQAVIWDYINGDVLELSGLGQPTTRAAIISKLYSMGHTQQTNISGVLIGGCNLGTGNLHVKSPPVFDPGCAPGETCNQTDEFDGSNGLDLVDTGDSFSASYEETVWRYFKNNAGHGNPYIPGTDSPYEHDDTVSDYTEIAIAVYAASLDPDGETKRIPCYYHTTGTFNYSEDSVMAYPGDYNSYAYTCEYEKIYHYKSYVDDSHSKNNIFTIEKNVSLSESVSIYEGWRPNSIFQDAYDMESDFQRDALVSFNEMPVSSALKKEIAVVIEQPVIHNEDSDEVWGFCQLYISADGEPVNHGDPDSADTYGWNDLVAMNMEDIFTALGTTYQDELESKKTSAGLYITIFTQD